MTIKLAAAEIKQIPNMAQRLQAAMQAAALFMQRNPKFNLGKFLDDCRV